METSQKQISLFGEEKLTSSPEDSLVSPIQWQESEKAKKMRDTSGRRCLEQLERFSRVGLWGRMFLASLIGQEDWFSTKCKLIWKLKDTKSSRLYCQLAVSMLPTEDIESGLLPTVTASDIRDGSSMRTDNNMKKGGRHGVSLHHLSYAGLLPTPKTKMINCPSEQKRNTPNLESMKIMKLLPTPNQRDWKGRTGSGWKEQSSLPNRMLPTPTAISDPKGGCTRPNPKRQNDTLAHAMHGQSNAKLGTTSQLNPRFVAEMMGFPVDWTELPFQNGETNQSKHTAMQ